MSEPADPVPPPNHRKRRLRFSLRTMLLAVLLLGSAAALWQNWQPWYKVCTITTERESVSSAFFNEDCSRVIWRGTPSRNSRSTETKSW